MISLTGMILKMRYCVVEEIGSGGEGHLYLARDMELGNYWAVKELPISKKREANAFASAGTSFCSKDGGLY